MGGRRTGTPETCSKTLGISLSLDGDVQVSDRSIDDTYFPGIREVLMDSGVSILNFSTCRKVLSLLRSVTGLHLW